ncbi:hypothetical protein EYC84_005093 [Monilinia fructicola]|uniref:Uncharacterized protein n=1 Tax=Monilinia fructicola TaxID=38448 RepID=A0A5M9JVG8_MONFR|nr:hypothetical protein EYC84_005093 [Monilinia fructicola]
MWGGVLNWVDAQNSSMPMHQYLHTQPPPSAPLYAQAHSSPTQSLSPREPNAKRDASTAASARFRQKKKTEGKEIKELEGENGFLKELVMGRIKWKEEKDNEEKDNEENNNEENENEGKEKDEAAAVETVDAYISTENVTIFNNTTSAGLAIPYTSISLHAIQRLPDPTDTSKGEVAGLFMQLETPPPAGEDIPSIIELVLIPAESDSTKTLYESLSNCSNLVPDEEDEDMEGGGAEIQFEGNIGYEGISGLPGVQQGATDGGLPPPFPGSGGWITAENVSEYFDADGNWIGGEESVEVEVLGDGAGRVRGHDEVEGGTEANGHDEADEASKRPRTD